MLKWLIAVILALVLFSALGPLLARLGLGRLPGDVRVTVGGRTWHLPIASTLIASALLSLVVWSLR